MHIFSSMSNCLSTSCSHHPLCLSTLRIVELFPAVPIDPHWGIVSKCLAYSKAACDPFVYSLLRHQYKKTCTDILNRLLKRSSLNASGRRLEQQGNSIPTAEWWRLLGNTNTYSLLMRTKINIAVSCPRLLRLALTLQKNQGKKTITTDKGKPLCRSTNGLPRAADQRNELAVRTKNCRLFIYLGW